MKKIILTTGTHREQEVVFIIFERDSELLQHIRKAVETKWSSTQKKWYALRINFDLSTFFIAIKPYAFVDYSALPKVKINTPEKIAEKIPEKPKVSMEINRVITTDAVFQIDNLKKWMEHKRYSRSSIESYTDAMRIFLSFYKDRDVKGLNNDDVQHFMNAYILKRGLSFSYQNQIVNALKLYFRIVEKTRIEIDKLERPRREHKLPNVLSKEEVSKILNVLSNLKHRTMLSMIYACGLRRSELLYLKPNHVDSKRGILNIKSAKGNKDRVVPISEKIVGMLRDYYKLYQPKEWLFEGQYAGEQYSEASLQKVLKNALAIAKIKKPVTLHWLRHSYATHLLDGGTDLRFIQELLGHKSSKTTEIYTHVTIKSLKNIKSPFDDL